VSDDINEQKLTNHILTRQEHTWFELPQTRKKGKDFTVQIKVSKECGKPRKTQYLGTGFVVNNCP
jgi:hypothetical protein